MDNRKIVAKLKIDTGDTDSTVKKIEEKKIEEPTLEGYEKISVKAPSQDQEVAMAATKIGELVFSFSFGSCVALIAKISGDKGKRFALKHATQPTKEALQDFIDIIEAERRDGQQVEIIYALKKDASVSRENDGKAPFMLFQIRDIIKDKDIKISRIDTENYFGVVCDASKNKIFFSTNFKMDYDQRYPSLEYEVEGKKLAFSIISEEVNEQDAATRQEAGGKTPTGVHARYGHLSPRSKFTFDSASKDKEGPAPSPAP